MGMVLLQDSRAQGLLDGFVVLPAHRGQLPDLRAVNMCLTHACTSAAPSLPVTLLDAAGPAAAAPGGRAPGEAQRLEHLPQREPLAVAEDDDLVRLLAQLALDEAQQVLLVHARGVVHVRVHLRTTAGACQGCTARAPGGSRAHACPRRQPCTNAARTAPGQHLASAAGSCWL